MSLVFHWFLPTSGDGRGIVGRGTASRWSATAAPSAYATGARAVAGRRTSTTSAQIARSAEQLGFTGVLTPTGTWCEDAWLATAALISQTQRLKFLVAFRPGLISPTLAAQMAATYQRISRGRLLLNVVTGGEDTEQRRFGDHLAHDQRYARTGEFLDIVRGAWSGRPYDFDGEHYQVEGATRHEPARPAADRVLRRLVAGRGPGRGQVRRRVPDLGRAAGAGGDEDRLDARAGRAGRPDAALRDPAAHDQPGHRQARPGPRRTACWPSSARTRSPRRRPLWPSRSRSASRTHARRCTSPTGTAAGAQDLEIYPNLWAGVGLVRGGAGTALVGSHAEVADRIEEYASLGIEEFIISGYPHLEEAYWFGEGVLPELRKRGAVAGAADSRLLVPA